MPTLHPTNLALMQVALISASCCVGLSAWSVVVVVVIACCCIPYRLVLMLAPTFAPCVLTFAPYILTFNWTLRLWCFPSFIWCKHFTAQVVVVSSCNLRWWCSFIQPLAQIVHLHTWWYRPLQLAQVVLHLHLGNLHCVVI